MLCDYELTEWRPRLKLRVRSEADEAANVLPIWMRALAPFREAREAVVRALREAAGHEDRGPYDGSDPVRPADAPLSGGTCAGASAPAGERGDDTRVHESGDADVRRGVAGSSDFSADGGCRRISPQTLDEEPKPP